MKFTLVCKTCPVEIRLGESVTTVEQAQWELKYHLSCYRDHEAIVTKRKLNGKRQEREAETGAEEPPR